jgi:hypothetical protein
VKGMRLVRNVAFVGFVVSVGAAKVSGVTPFCPDGCDCNWQSAPWTSVVDCYQVLNCEETYPTFCDDFEDALVYWCGDPTLVGSWSCWGGPGGGCYGEGNCIIPD